MVYHIFSLQFLRLVVFKSCWNMFKMNKESGKTKINKLLYINIEENALVLQKNKINIYKTQK